MYPQFQYSIITGLLYHTKPPRNQYKNKQVAGTLNNYGYVVVRVDGKNKKAHRVIYEMVTGEPIPKGMVIDHIDGDKSNNAWINLRLATVSLNRMNSPKHKHITRDKRVKSERYKVVVNKQYLGYYNTLEEACQVRDRAVAEMLRVATNPTQQP